MARRKLRDRMIPVLPSSYPTMRPLSASEAIGPALERTRDVLARPFRLGTFLKLAAVAFFAEIGGGLNLNLPGRGGNLHGIPPVVRAFFVAFAIIFGVAALIVGLVFFYLSSRLQLVLLEIVATRQTFVAPVWRRYSAAVWRWIGLKVLFFLVALLLSLLFAAPIIFYIVTHHIGFGSFSNGNPFSALHLSQIIFFVAIVLILLLVIGIAYSLIRDLGLPFLALQGLGIPETLGRLWDVMATEPGPVALFILLRFVLGLAFGIAAELAIALALIVSLIPLVLVGGFLWAVLHNAGAGGIAVLIGCAILGGLIFLCWAVCVFIALIGPLLIFNQAYALYFLGGRFPLLGDLLDRSTLPPTYAYSPTFPQYPPPYYPPQPGPPTGPSPGQ